MIDIEPQRTEELLDRLLKIWLSSVEITHGFLQPQDIVALRPLVRSALGGVKKLFVYYEQNAPIGFLGLEGDKIEMLFLAAEWIGKGFGKALILEAIENHGAKFVDVNEDNPNAVEFYKKFGFVQFDRSAFDEQGNPFPILKMKKQ